MSLDRQVAFLAVLNVGAEAIKKLVTWIEPVLNPVLLVGQIVIAVVTVVWLYYRVKGVRLDNRLKEIEIRKAETQ